MSADDIPPDIQALANLVIKLNEKGVLNEDDVKDIFSHIEDIDEAIEHEPE